MPLLTKPFYYRPVKGAPKMHHYKNPGRQTNSVKNSKICGILQDCPAASRVTDIFKCIQAKAHLSTPKNILLKNLSGFPIMGT
jgi:hypothetical protein